MHYYTGDFNGTHFVADNLDSTKLIDWASDYYAPQMYHDLSDDSDGIIFGWAAAISQIGGEPTGKEVG